MLIEDADDPGHLFVVSEWRSREAADKVLIDYATSPNARLANELVARAAPPHRRASLMRTLGDRLSTRCLQAVALTPAACTRASTSVGGRALHLGLGGEVGRPPRPSR